MVEALTVSSSSSSSFVSLPLSSRAPSVADSVEGVATPTLLTSNY